MELHETCFRSKDTYGPKVKGWKKIFHRIEIEKKKKAKIVTYQTKQTLKQ